MPIVPAPADLYSAREAIRFLSNADLVRFFKAAGIDLVAASAYAPALVTLSANQNNWAPGVKSGYPVDVTTAVTVTGLVAGEDYETRWLWNVGDSDLTLAHDSSSSTAANRFACPDDADATVAAGGQAQLLYDSVLARWRVAA